MVQYQMLLQLAMNMVFHFDGTSLTNAQASSMQCSTMMRPASDVALQKSSDQLAHA